MEQAQRDNNFLERSGWVWMAIFYGSVIFPAILALRAPALADRRSDFLLLCLGILALHSAAIALALRGGEEARQRAWPQALLLLGAFYLWYRLVDIDPIFYTLLFGMYGQIYLLVQIRVALGLGAILTGFVTVSQLVPGGSIWDSSAILYFLAFSIFGGLLGVWINGIIRQSTERREMIAQLRETQEQLAQAERREGMLAERQRLAREIHDTLAQGFTSIVMHLETAEQSLLGDTTTTQRHLDLARRTARESLAEARRVVRDLRPELLEVDSLPRALEHTVSKWTQTSGLRGASVVTGDVLPLHPEVEVTLLRAVQEALNNVRKHARARTATVTLSYMEDVVILDVQDDGVGLARAHGNDELNSGFGLRSMRERIEQLNGSLLVESEPDAGTTLVIEIPITGRSIPIQEKIQ